MNTVDEYVFPLGAKPSRMTVKHDLQMTLSDGWVKAWTMTYPRWGRDGVITNREVFKRDGHWVVRWSHWEEGEE